MADRLSERLSVTEWTQAHAAAVAYADATYSVETPPTVTDDNATYRFARIQAHDGTLAYAIKNATTVSAPTYGTGALRVVSGTYDVVQIPRGATLYVAGVGAAVNGSVVWGR